MLKLRNPKNRDRGGEISGSPPLTRGGDIKILAKATKNGYSPLVRGENLASPKPKMEIGGRDFGSPPHPLTRGEIA